MRLSSQSARRRRGSVPQGQALVEFGIIAFVLTLLLAAMVTLGMMFHSNHVLQQAADVAAQELARLPLPPVLPPPDQIGPTSSEPHRFSDPNRTDTIWGQERVQQEIFHERHLVIDLTNNEEARADLDAYFAGLPLLNRLLRPLMIREERLIDGQRVELIRYPGALVDYAPEPNGPIIYRTVLVPILIYDESSLRPTGVRFESVVQQLNPDEFSPESGGVIGLRINYPYQSGAMISYRYEVDGRYVGPSEALGTGGVVNFPAQYEDADLIINQADLRPYELRDVPDLPSQAGVVNNVVHRGDLGLGTLSAWGGTVRPYRKVLSAQGIYRREMFALP